MKSKESELRRIKRVLKYLENRGVNKESVNTVYRKILNEKFNKL